MAEREKNRGKILLVAVIAISVLAVAMGTGVVELPNFTGGPPGDAPKVTYKTEVHLYRAYLTPKIVGVSTEKTSQTYSEIAQKNYEVHPTFLNWKGTVKLTINYPNSPTPITSSHEFRIGTFSDLYIPFIWTSKQRGTHTLTIEMYDESGTLVDSTTETVSR